MALITSGFCSLQADGNLYTGFTDGNVHDDVTGSMTNALSEGKAPLYTVTHGQAAIVGDDPFELNITKVRDPPDAPGPPLASVGVSIGM